MSGVQKRSPAYVVLLESRSDSELANIVRQTPNLFRTPDYVIFKQRWGLRATSSLNEHNTLLFFGYMTGKRYIELPTFMWT